MTSASPQRTLWLAAGGLLAVVFTLWAGFSLAGWTVGSVSKREHHVLSGRVDEVQIDGSAGDVTLVPSDGREVVVDSRAKGTLWLPKMQTQISGGHVTVSGSCKIVLFGSCSASFVVRVPEGTPVVVKTSSGDVNASGLTGAVSLDVSSGDVNLVGLTGGTDVHVSSGDIDAHRLGGRLVLESSSGDVDATELTADRVNAHASSGDVFVDLVEAPQRVTASASSGDVTISVPRGDAYAANADSSSGDGTVGVDQDSRSDRSLDAVTSSGDASILYRDG